MVFFVAFGAGVGATLFCGKEFHIPGSGFRMMRELVANPSGTLLAMDFRCSNLVTSISCKEVGGSGFMVSFSGAENSRFWLES